ncbi:hypothetical protein [Hyphobacterium indicum]|uniref:hypothetical protein n=1 Tax=Hyphobacterium indicum TaxID=2162714 RepID=UPI001374CB2C|nr:hypothetical protein [Hyphobacterium indicum]
MDKFIQHLASANQACRCGDPSLLMSEDGSLTVEWAPFDHIEKEAKLVIVGLTPGRQQADNALKSCFEHLQLGASISTSLKAAKKFASFSGPMRTNLIAMLDKIGLSNPFGVETCADFFKDKSSSVHFTSAVRYPVFKSGLNYSGSPRPLGNSMLRSLIETKLGEEVLAIPGAVWVPLGHHAESVLQHFVDCGSLSSKVVFSGLPHPSGANMERIAYFLGKKPRNMLSPKTNPDKIDFARQSLLDKVALI